MTEPELYKEPGILTKDKDKRKASHMIRHSVPMNP